MEKPQIPLFLNPVQAGFASAADDFIEKKLNLNDHLISHPAATFFVKVEGDSMKDAGIHKGDILIVDRALEPISGQIVIATVNAEFTVKRLKIEQGRTWLEPENPKYKALEIKPHFDFQIFGVVTYAIHDVRAH